MALPEFSLPVTESSVLTGQAPALVTVIIPTRNRCQLLGQTLKSIRRQTYKSWNAIVVDDGSTDDTGRVLQRHCEEDPRIRWMARPKDETSGASYCRNLGLQTAGTEYVVFLDSDDLLAPECLERRIEIIRKHPEADFVVFQAEVFRESPGDLKVPFNRFKTQPDLDRLLHLDHPWQTTAPIWRADSLKRIGGWDPSLPSWQDWELNIRAICRGLRYVKVDSCDYYFRRNDSAERTSVNQRNNPAHLAAAILLFRKVSSELQHTGHLTPARRRALLGLAFLTVMRLNWDHSFRLGMAGWRRARTESLISRFDYVLGSLVLASLKPPIVKNISWRTFLKLYRYKIGWKTNKYMI